jgi:hypothetical protein
VHQNDFNTLLGSPATNPAPTHKSPLPPSPPVHAASFAQASCRRCFLRREALAGRNRLEPCVRASAALMTRIDPLDEYTPQNISYEPRPSAARAPPRPSADNYEPVNSDDELDQQPISAAEYVELERRFEERLRARGLHIRRMLDDGNCLFRSVSDRVYGDAEMHDVVRRLCLDHMEKERDHFSQYVTEDFDAYLRRKRRDRVFGNHLEIQAISEIYNRPVHVFDVRGDTEAPMNTFTAPSEGEAGAPLRLSYHGRSHYNVIIDPTVADVGDGLGLPGFHPGLADRMQVEQAQQASETSAIESQLLLSARDASDVDATQDALLQAALAASAAEAGVGWAGGAGAASWPGAGIGAWAGVARSCWACMQVLTTAPVPLSPHRYRRMGRRGRMGRRRERGRERCLLRRRQRALRLVRAYGVGC